MGQNSDSRRALRRASKRGEEKRVIMKKARASEQARVNFGSRLADPERLVSIREFLAAGVSSKEASGRMTSDELKALQMCRSTRWGAKLRQAASNSCAGRPIGINLSRENKKWGGSGCPVK